MQFPPMREGFAEGPAPRRMGGDEGLHASDQNLQETSQFPPKTASAMKRQVQLQLLERQQQADVAGGMNRTSAGGSASEGATSTRSGKLALSHHGHYEQTSPIDTLQQQVSALHMHSERDCIPNLQRESQHGELHLQRHLAVQSSACLSEQHSTPALGLAVFDAVNDSSHSLNPMPLQGSPPAGADMLHSPDSVVAAAASTPSALELPAVAPSLPRFPLSAPFAPGCERPPLQLPHALRREADLQSLLLQMTQRDAQQLSAAAAQQQAFKCHLRQQQQTGGGVTSLGAGDSSPWIHPAEACINPGFACGSAFGDEPPSSGATAGGLHASNKCVEAVSVRVPALVQGKYHSLLLLDSPEKLERQQQLKEEQGGEQGSRRLPSRSVSFCGYPTVCYKALCLDDPHAYVLRVVEDFPLSNFDLVKAAVKRWSPCSTSHPGLVPLRQAFATADFAACRADASGSSPSLRGDVCSERKKRVGGRGEDGVGVAAARGERTTSLGQRFGDGGGAIRTSRRDSNAFSGFESSDSGEDTIDMTNSSCNSSSVVFVFDFFPNWYSMEELYFQVSPEEWQMQRQLEQQNRQSGQQGCGSYEWRFAREERGPFSGGHSAAAPTCTVPEGLLWSFALQILMALSHVHSHGLAYGALFPSKVLVSYRYRVRLNACGICAATLYGHQGTTAGVASAPPGVATGRERASNLAPFPTGAGSAGPTAGTREGERNISGGGGPSALAQQQRADLVLLGCLLLGLACETVSASELLVAYGHRALPLLQQQQQLADAMEQLLFREATHNRLMFLLSKICFIADRPGPVCGEERWSALSERYIVGLFRDYLFFQRGSLNEPVLDLAHVFDGLAKCDTGAPESALLMSADGASVLLTPYKDIRRCIEKSFAELVAAAASPFSAAGMPSFNPQLENVGGSAVGRTSGTGGGSPASTATAVGGNLQQTLLNSLNAPPAFLASGAATAEFVVAPSTTTTGPGSVLLASHQGQSFGGCTSSATSAALQSVQHPMAVAFGRGLSSLNTHCAFPDGVSLPYADGRLHGA